MNPTTAKVSLAAVGVAAVIGLASLVLPTKPPPPPCPEVVTRSGAHNEPRNAAGQIRYCWPGMARCRCDADRDCYALSGYVACTALLVAPKDAGVRDVPRLDVPPMADVGTARDVTAPPADLGSARDVAPVLDAGPVTGLAFQGAEGWGATATGGRGGRVLVVTNLAASGPGSLQAALSETGRRVIVFRVSGVINSDIHIDHGDVTIAGQTSPGGITVRGIDTTETPFVDQDLVAARTARKVDNVVIRFLRSRPAGGQFPDGLRLRYVHHAIVDHVSIGNAADEAVEISYSHDITIQNVLLAETVGGHAQYGGMLINYTNPAAGYALDNLTIVRNAWVRIQGRYPEMSRESVGAAGTTLRAEVSGNYFHDRRFYSNFEASDVSGDDQGRAIHYAVNVAGNLSRVGPSFSYGQTFIRAKAPGTTAFLDGNVLSRFPALDSWSQNYCCNDLSLTNHGSRPSWARASRHPFPAVTLVPVASLRAYVASSVGSLPRDTMDARLLSFVSSDMIDTRPINQGAGDALRPIASPAAAPLDSDADGMPDAYEATHGTDPRVYDPNVARNGLTALDVYLDWIAAERLAGR